MMEGPRARAGVRDAADPVVRAVGRALVRLWSAPVPELRRATSLDPLHIERLRDVLDVLARTLLEPDPGSGARLDAAWSALGGGAIRRVAPPEESFEPPPALTPAPSNAFRAELRSASRASREPASFPASTTACEPARPAASATRPSVSAPSASAPSASTPSASTPSLRVSPPAFTDRTCEAPPPTRRHEVPGHGETEPLDLDLLRRSMTVLPFHGERPPPPPSAPPSHGPARPGGSPLDETSAVLSPLVLVAVLPFGVTPPPSSAPPVSASPAPGFFATPALQAAPGSFTTPALQAAPGSFAPSPAPRPATPSSGDSPSAWSALAATGTAAAANPLDETSASLSSLVLSQALPFAREAPSASPATASAALGLDAYASFCAARSSHPGHERALAARFGLTSAEAVAALDAAWRERAAREPAVAQALAARVAEYRAWFEAQAARGRAP